MCGICGIIGTSRQADRQAIHAMTDVLVHRGPDGEGHFALRAPDGSLAGWFGHRRLRVIDLTEAAHQPMSSADGRVVLTYNGEIYNFRELRRELLARGHTFVSTGDTEVVLRAYEEWGEACIQRLDGMFAFAIWDGRDGHLVLARDRPGKKPLYYAHDRGRLVFGSEIKALIAAGIRAEVATEHLAHYLTFGYVPHPATMVRNVEQLPPGSQLSWHPGSSPRISSYWQPAYPATPADFRHPDGKLLAEIREAFAAATARRMVADVPIGAFLSGGVDSSLVVAAMVAHASRDVHTLSIGFPDDPPSDERRYARIVAEQLGTRHTELAVQVDAVALLDRLVWHYDEPFADCSAIPTYIVSQLASELVTVVLNGDGGDEVFGGYDRFRAAMIADWVPRSAAPAGRWIARALPAGSGYFNLRRRVGRFFEAAREPILERYISWISVLDEARLSAILRPEFRQLSGAHPDASFRSQFDAHPGLPPLDRILAANFATYLPDDLAVKMDRMSMANSVETRSPFLDTALVDLLARVPATRKIGLRRVKPLLAKAFGPNLPDEIWKRRKQGFGPPMHAWFRGPLGELFEDEVLGQGSVSIEYLRRDALAAMYSAHRSGLSDEGFRLWAILTLERWLRTVSAPLRAQPPAQRVVEA